MFFCFVYFVVSVSFPVPVNKTIWCHYILLFMFNTFLRDIQNVTRYRKEKKYYKFLKYIFCFHPKTLAIVIPILIRRVQLHTRFENNLLNIHIYFMIHIYYDQYFYIL